MTDELKQIAYNEGYECCVKNILYVSDNPYSGVSDELAVMFSEGWWDAFLEDKENEYQTKTN